MKNSIAKLSLLITTIALTISPADAQSIRPAIDSTGTLVNNPENNPNLFNINGGTQSGRNLFHSFEQFGLNANQIANFQSNPTIQNIFSRVVSGNPSVINGLIQVSGGKSNLFLMNPSGILFGPNARLNVTAAFTATTSNGIGFREQFLNPIEPTGLPGPIILNATIPFNPEFASTWFNATGDNRYDILTQSPDRFAFTMGKPGAIVNFGKLSVSSGNNLFLIGGSVLSTGELSAPNGVVKVASITSSNVVRINNDSPSLTLSLELSNTTSQPFPWTLPTLDLPTLLTGNPGITEAAGIRKNADGTVDLIASGVQVNPKQATIAINNLLQVSSVFTNDKSILDPIGERDDFGSVIERFDASPKFVIDQSIGSPELRFETTLIAVNKDGENPSEQNKKNSSTPQSKNILFSFNSDPQAPSIESSGSSQNQTGSTSETTSDDTALSQDCLSNPSKNDRMPTDLTCEKSRLFTLANKYRNAGEYLKAIATYQKGLEIDDRNNPRNSGRILNNLGATYQLIGQYEKALEIQQRALQIRQQTGDRLGLGNTFSNIGVIYSNLGQYSKAIDAYQQSLKIFKVLGNRQAEADVLNNLGLIDDSLGQYNQAIAKYQQVLAIRKQMGDRSGESSVLNNLGLVYQHQEQYPQALTFYQQALALRQTLGDRLRITESLGNIGDIQTKLKQYPQAIETLQQALKQSQTLGRRDNEGDILNTLGDTYLGLGQPQPALEFYQQALAIMQSIGNRPYEIRVLSRLGAFYQKQDNNSLSIAFYKQSVNISEDIRKDIRSLSRSQQESYAQTVAKDYRTLADLLLLQGRILEAQQVLELMKVQEIRDFTRNTKVKNNNTGIAPTAAEESILQEHGTLIAFGQKVFDCKRLQCNQLSQFNDQLQALTQQYNQTVQTFSQEVRDRRAQDDAFLDPNKFLPKARAIVEAQPKTVLIYPLVMKDKLWLVWASKGGIIKSIRLPITQSQLGQTVIEFRQLLQNPISSPQEVKDKGKVLYDWLIKPIESELQSNQIKNLVFSLDRTTRYIPMAALYDGKQYLVENYNISTILSADLTDLRDRNALSGPDISILALGVSESINNFPSLPNVPAELNAIVRQPPEKQGVYPGLKFLNKAFDFRTFRDNLFGHKIVHIATHAEFTAGRPEDSFLLLGTGDKLTIPEIQTLQDLSEVQLVVLSACETGLGGADQEGTEISGINSYFLNGGAKAVMASLWTVDDASTSQLMRSFYSNLATPNSSQKITKSEALRQSQLELLSTKNSEYAHPYFWAPFVITGNGF